MTTTLTSLSSSFRVPRVFILEHRVVYLGQNFSGNIMNVSVNNNNYIIVLFFSAILPRRTRPYSR